MKKISLEIEIEDDGGKAFVHFSIPGFKIDTKGSMFPYQLKLIQQIIELVKDAARQHEKTGQSPTLSK